MTPSILIALLCIICTYLRLFRLFVVHLYVYYSISKVDLTRTGQTMHLKCLTRSYKRRINTGRTYSGHTSTILLLLPMTILHIRISCVMTMNSNLYHSDTFTYKLLPPSELQSIYLKRVQIAASVPQMRSTLYFCNVSL